MHRYLSRKSFVTTLGAAGLGLTAATLGRAPSAMAQDEDAATEDDQVVQEFADFREKKVELYNAFTAALAEELDIASADEVDGAIRIAMMAVIDDQVSEDGLTAGQAEALKTLVATSDVPIPAMGFGSGHGMFMAKGHGPGFSMGDHHMMPSRGRVRIREQFSERAEESGPAGDDSQTDEE